jgi:hypothetical protein
VPVVPIGTSALIDDSSYRDDDKAEPAGDRVGMKKIMGRRVVPAPKLDYDALSRDHVGPHDAGSVDLPVGATSMFRLLFPAAVALLFVRPSAAGEIHTAVIVDDLAGVRKALAKDPKAVNSRDEAGKTALHWAAHGGQLGIVKVLVEAGADVNAGDQFTKKTPLQEAATKNHIEVARYLIDHKADVNAINSWKVNALHSATYGEGRKPLVELLIAKGAKVVQVNNLGESPLVGSVLHGDLATFEVLAKYPFDFNEANEDGRTLLHVAVSGSSPSATKNRDAMVTRLLALGVRPDAKDRRGLTAADLAERERLPAIAARLRGEAGQKSSAPGRSKSTTPNSKSTTPRARSSTPMP